MEILTDDHDRPYWIEFGSEETPKQALAAVPDETLLEAFAERWRRVGLEPPKRTAGGLRRRILEAWRAQPTRSGPSRVPVSEAARLLGIPERTLRWQIQAGERQAERRRRDGRLEFEVEVPSVTRKVLVSRILGPDPRIIMLMAQEGCRPGELHRLGYRRRPDGEAWRGVERW